MQIVANENCSKALIRELRARGHDVLAVKETMRGASDELVLERARAESRVVLTFDKGFGELAYRARLPCESGVVLLRLGGRNPQEDLGRALAALESRKDWQGHFAVITSHEIRIRPLPTV